jgi:isovaleryl-CoA dehydrogenase
VRDFVRKKIEPQAEERDQSGTLNVELMKRLGDLGLLGAPIPEQNGGAGVDAIASVIVPEELCWSDPGLTLAHLAHALPFVNNFYYAGTDDQRKRYLPKALSGEWIGAMGMTEPAVGTDVLGMKTIAKKDGEDYVLTGRKTFITNGTEARVFIIYARLEDRITTFLVERDFDGFTTGPKTPSVGSDSPFGSYSTEDPFHGPGKNPAYSSYDHVRTERSVA